MKIAVTGANGNLGRRLIRSIREQFEIRAIVRSAGARQALHDAVDSGVDTVVVDYADADGLARALDGCDQVVHLVGIIRESKANPFRQAHEAATAALISAAAEAGLGSIINLSIIGADARSRNACLASRGRADDMLLSSAVPASIIRVPMVLGEGDHASAALRRQASRRLVLTLRADSLEQPVYAGDVVAALCACLTQPGAGVLALGGPESVTRRDLIRRAAAVVGGDPRVISLPVEFGLLVASVLERLPEPPVTRAMLGVLDHDDRVDVGPALRHLGIELTPLDETIRRVMHTGPSEEE